MKCFRNYPILLFGFLFSAVLFAQFPYENFEIVESIPVETILDNPQIRNAADVWIEMIQSAQKTIDIEQFYISNRAGEALEPVIREIEKAADRSVTVRVIADNRMAGTYPETLERLNNHEHISVRKIAVYNQNGGVQHSKFFIVDQEQVFLGSQNFDWRALDHIHEIGLRIHDTEYARRMTSLFDLDWKQSQNKRIYSLKSVQKDNWIEMSVGDREKLRFLATASPIGNIPAPFREDLSTIITLIDGAKDRIYVQLLSYSPLDRDHWFGDLDEALRRAAARGVDVRLLCSDWCQHKYEMPYLKQLVKLDNLDVKLSTIPQWSKGYISFARVEHCKFMIIDDTISWVGSSNWKRDYFYSSRNVAVIVENERMNDELSAIFLKSWNGPYTWRVDSEKKYQPKYYGEKD